MRSSRLAPYQTAHRVWCFMHSAVPAVLQKGSGSSERTRATRRASRMRPRRVATLLSGTSRSCSAQVTSHKGDDGQCRTQVWPFGRHRVRLHRSDRSSASVDSAIARARSEYPWVRLAARRLGTDPHAVDLFVTCRVLVITLATTRMPSGGRRQKAWLDQRHRARPARRTSLFHQMTRSLRYSDVYWTDEGSRRKGWLTATQRESTGRLALLTSGLSGCCCCAMLCPTCLLSIADALASFGTEVAATPPARCLF